MMKFLVKNYEINVYLLEKINELFYIQINKKFIFMVSFIL